MVRFKNRIDAAQKLAASLKKYKNSPNTIVLGLARGGVVTAAEIARILQLPLDVMIVRKIGAPLEEELAIGAVTQSGVVVLNQILIDQMNIPQDYVQKMLAKEREECQNRQRLYRSHYPAKDVKDKNVILVDDGIATGLTMEAAIKDMQQQNVKSIVVAVPVMPSDEVSHIKKLCNQLVYLIAAEGFLALGAFYKDFTQVNHDEVIAQLKDVAVGV